MPEEEDWEWTITVAVYGDAKRAHIKRMAAWKENKGKAFRIVASHCPSEVMAELRNQPDWTEIEDSNDVIGLLLLIRDLSQNKTSDTQGTMALVENDLTMFRTAQTADQTIENYLAEFQANREAIIAHGGNPGYHPKICKAHLAKKRAEEGMDEGLDWTLAAYEGRTDNEKAAHTFRRESPLMNN